MRLKAQIWINAYIRRCNAQGAFALVVRHGDDDAGAIYIKVLARDGSAALYGPAPAGMAEAAQDRRWSLLARTEPGGAGIDERLAAEARIDSDIWIIEVEDGQGRHLLDDWLVADR